MFFLCKIMVITVGVCCRSMKTRKENSQRKVMVNGKCVREAVLNVCDLIPMFCVRHCCCFRVVHDDDLCTFFEQRA